MSSSQDDGKRGMTCNSGLDAPSLDENISPSGAQWITKAEGMTVSGQLTLYFWSADTVLLSNNLAFTKTKLFTCLLVS